MNDLTKLAEQWGPNGIVAVVFIVWMIVQSRDNRSRSARQEQHDMVWNRLIETFGRLEKALDQHDDLLAQSLTSITEHTAFMKGLNGAFKERLFSMISDKQDAA